ncbi:MAG: hypothetical protein Q7S51_11315 [Gallionellaceae bacterium]|nr:hypothetical protein [Gallionellaceae bacterium]
MKKFLFVIAMLVATSVFAADVGISVSVGQPGFYGRLDIGNLPHPPLLFPAPVIIKRSVHVGEPVYLHVPPGHAKNWRKHCRKYNACGQPVYFVQEDWYNNEYAPRYRERHNKHGHDEGGDHKEGKGKHKNKGKHGKD